MIEIDRDRTLPRDEGSEQRSQTHHQHDGETEPSAVVAEKPFSLRRIEHVMTESARALSDQRVGSRNSGGVSAGCLRQRRCCQKYCSGTTRTHFSSTCVKRATMASTSRSLSPVCFASIGSTTIRYFP